MRPFRLGTSIFLLALGLMFGMAFTARAQVTYNTTGPGGCFQNPTSGAHIDCATATFSLMTGGNTGTGNPGTAISGLSSSGVTGLQIVLKNTSTNTAYINADFLTGFFWGITGNPTLFNAGSGAGAYVGGSAIATNSLGNAAILNPTQCTTNPCTGTSVNVGGYWESSYKVGGWSAFTGAYAVSTSGYTSLSLGQGTQIGQTNTKYLNGNSSNNFALIGSVNAGPLSIGSSFPLAQDTVTIKLAFAANQNLNLSTDIANVNFTYGTAREAASAGKKAPEPASIALFGVGMLGLSMARRLRKGRQQAV